MANAVFTSSVSYTPGGGGSLTQGFRVAFEHSASVAGTIDVAAGSSTKVDIPFGSVGDVLGFVLQNNTDSEVDVEVGGNSVCKIAAGGVILQFVPKKSTKSLTAVKATPSAPTKAGTIDFIVLGN